MLNPINVGKAVSKIRKKQKMSQETLSKLANIGRTHLSMIECGTRKPTLETIFKISEALGIPASELVREIESQ